MLEECGSMCVSRVSTVRVCPSDSPGSLDRERWKSSSKPQGGAGSPQRNLTLKQGHRFGKICTPRFTLGVLSSHGSGTFHRAQGSPLGSHYLACISQQLAGVIPCFPEKRPGEGSSWILLHWASQEMSPALLPTSLCPCPPLMATAEAGYPQRHLLLPN